MKGLWTGILIVLCFNPSAFSAAPIATNSFVRHDIQFSAAPLDFAVGAWKTNGEAMIAAVTLGFNSPNTNVPRWNLEIIAIGANSEFNGPPVVYEAPGATGPIAIGDINGDGANDIVYGAGTNVVVHLNTSSVTAPAFESIGTFEAGAAGTPSGLALADLDGDGKLDIVYATASIYALHNESTDGAIAFAAPITIFTNAVSFQVADLDGDGRPDLKVTTTLASPGSLLRNTSSPGALSFVRITFNSAVGQQNLLDANGDAKADVVSLVHLRVDPFGGESETELMFATNTSAPGAITFGKSITTEIDVPASDFPARSRIQVPSFRPNFSSGDFNQDGRPDFVFADWTNRVVFLENLNITPQTLMSWGSGIVVGARIYPYEPTVADVNGDGKADVVIGSASRIVSIFENRIAPIPELVALVETAEASVSSNAVVNLRAVAYAADVTAVEFFEDGKLVATATAADGLRAQYQPTTPGVHRITARATAGANAGLESKAAGLRVRGENPGRVIGFGTGISSQTMLLIYDSGRAFGVGSNARGQLADIFYDSPHPGFVEIAAPTNAGGWKGLTAGMAFTIGITESNRVFSWGGNDMGQLGRDSIALTNPVPGEIIFNGGAAIQKVVAGREFATALDANGELYSWGANVYGQLGTGDTAPRARPRQIKKPEGVTRWKDVSAGMVHTLALDDAGQLYGWGWNFWGQAGQPRTNVAILEPMRIELPPGETAWTNIDAGVSASHAQTASGRTYRWGDYLTDGGEVSDHVPALLEDPEGSGGFKTIGAGSPLTVGLGNDGNAYVWGGGILSPTGLGDQTAVTNPTRLPLPAGVQSWSSIAVASRRAAALADDGRVFVWGYDAVNALGTGTTMANIPTEPCLPLENCASNYPPVVKIVHPAYGDIFPADGIFRFEIAADDFDGVIDFVKIMRADAVIGGQLPGINQTEVARLHFGETTAEIAIPKTTTSGTTFFPIAYDNSGLVRTGAVFRPILPPTALVQLRLTNSAPINALTGWRETFAGIHNSSSFTFGSVLAVISNVPPGVTIRNSTFPSAAGVETVTDPFRLAPGESTTLRIEYKLADDVPGALLTARMLPGAANGVGPSTGEVQPVTLTLLTNGLNAIEFDHAAGEQHVVQFSETLTNWFDAGGFFEPGDGKMLWLDGGPPATSKSPTQAGRRFYRVLRKP